VQSSVLAGASVLVNDTTKTLDVLVANPMGGLPRNDIVVFDATVPAVTVIIGTPNAAPTDPTVPTTAVRLARLRHAASATTIPTASIDQLQVLTYLRGVVPTDDTGWLVPTLTNSWSSISSGRSVRYRRINGIVYLRGMCSGGTTTSVMVLPAGFRPAIDSRTLQQSTDSGTTAVAVVITAATGQIAASTGTQPSFDHISFPADA